MNYVILFDALNNRNPRPCSHYVISSEGVINAVYKDGIGVKQCIVARFCWKLICMYVTRWCRSELILFVSKLILVWLTSNLSYKIRFWQTFCTSLSSVEIHFQSNYNVNIMISWVAICKFMQSNIIFKTIFEYIHNKFCFVHTNTFCKYRKKIRASPRVQLVVIPVDSHNRGVQNYA